MRHEPSHFSADIALMSCSCGGLGILQDDQRYTSRCWSSQGEDQPFIAAGCRKKQKVFHGLNTSRSHQSAKSRAIASLE